MIRQLRVYDKERKTWIYSGRTPSMMIGFWQHVGQDDPFEHIGLSDIEGKDIYADDIVENTYNGKKRLFHIYWNEENACFWAALIHDHIGKNTHDRWKAGAVFSPAISCKVIGNGTENPELLPTKEKSSE